MGDDDQWRAGGEFVEIGGEPGELGVVDASFPGAVVREVDAVEDDEVVALVIEGLVGGSDALFEHFFAVAGGGGFDAGLSEQAEVVVVADGVVDFESEGLLGVVVEVEEAVGALAIGGEGVEDVVSALDSEVGGDGGGPLEGEGTAVGGGEFGLDMGVREEKEVEAAGSRRSFNSARGGKREERRAGGDGGGGRQELAAVDGAHGRMVARC